MAYRDTATLERLKSYMLDRAQYHADKGNFERAQTCIDTATAYAKEIAENDMPTIADLVFARLRKAS